MPFFHSGVEPQTDVVNVIRSLWKTYGCITVKQEEIFLTITFIISTSARTSSNGNAHAWLCSVLRSIRSKFGQEIVSYSSIWISKSYDAKSVSCVDNPDSIWPKTWTLVILEVRKRSIHDEMHPIFVSIKNEPIQDRIKSANFRQEYQYRYLWCLVNSA